MSSQEQANQQKDLGNAALTSGDFQKAVEHYTKGIELDPTNFVLYSNRSAAYANLKQYTKALEDAEKCIQTKKDWAKGYSRKGAALEFLNRLEEAKVAYEQGLQIEPGNAQLQQSLQAVEASILKTKQQGEPNIGDIFANLFQGDVIGKLRQNEVTKEYLEDKAFVSLIEHIQTHPAEISASLKKEPRMANVLGVLMGMGPLPKKGEAWTPKQENKESVPKEEKKEPEPKTQPKEAEPTTQESPNQDTNEAQKKQANEEKEKGNEYYKKKDFNNAIEHWKKAMELDPDNMSYQTNIAAAYFEMKNFEECITQCQAAIETGRRVFADYKLISKAFHRIGNANMKLENFDEAVKAYSHALTEHRNADSLQALQKAEKAKAERDKQNYFSVDKSQEAKALGNECFRKQDYPGAIKHYTDAIARNPNDAVLYSNRAACYTKLGEYQIGLKDCDKCLELDPKFVKGYTRKGHIQFFQKQYHKCLETYEAGLEIEPENPELIEGVQRTMQAITSRGQSEESDKEAIANAARDPEIQNILQDPMMKQVLSALSTDPAGSQHYLRDPVIAGKISKLVAAGILRTK